jgi:hypothetical protein
VNLKLSSISTAANRARSAPPWRLAVCGRTAKRTTFIGLEGVRSISYRSTRNEDTRCYFCKNNCLRTFIDVKTVASADLVPVNQISKVPLQAGEQRLIIATCEKGTVEDMESMKDIKSNIDSLKAAYPNFVEVASREPFRFRSLPSLADPVPQVNWRTSAATRQRIELMNKRKDLRVGIPRLLNQYVYAPLFNAYFESLGLKSQNIIYSDYTSSELYRAGSSRGAIDPCFPAKIGIRHVHNLLTCQVRAQEAEHNLLPHGRCAPFAVGEPYWDQCLSDRHSHTRNGESGLHEGKQRVCRCWR